MQSKEIAWRRDITSMHTYYSDFCFVISPDGRKPRYIIKYVRSNIINNGEWYVLMHRRDTNTYQPIRETPFQDLTEAKRFTNAFESKRLSKNRRS